MSKKKLTMEQQFIENIVKKVEENLIVSVGMKIIENIGEKGNKQLKGIYKKQFEKYCEKIDEDVEFIKKEYELNKKERDKFDKEILQDLEIERTHVKCVFLFLQNESEYKLVKKTKQKVKDE